MRPKSLEKMVDKVLDLEMDRERADIEADRAWADGNLDKYESLLRQINCLDGVIVELNNKIDTLGGL